MARFYFDCECDGTVHQDGCGIHLDVGEVPNQATEVLLELIKERLPDENNLSIRVSVRDEAGAQVYVAHGTVSGAYCEPTAPGLVAAA